MAAAELAGSREAREETGSLSWEFKENTSFNLFLCDQRNTEMVPIKRNGSYWLDLVLTPKEDLSPQRAPACQGEMLHMLTTEGMLSTKHVACVECGEHGRWTERQTHAQHFIF